MPIIDLKITLQTPLQIGPGTRDARGRPFLAASRLKGLHRAAAEDMAVGLGLHACTKRDPAQMCHPLTGVCVICQIFGSAWQPGRIFYRDLIVSTTPTTVKSVRVTHSRRRGVRMAVGNTEFEVVPAGTVFIGSAHHVIGNRGLLALAVAALRSVAAIGGANSLGYGLCKVDAWALDSNRQPITERELADALRGLK